MKSMNHFKSGLIAITLAVSISGCKSNETPSEKAQAEHNKALDSAKEIYRNSKDEICELINGKMECVAQKIENKTKTAIDKTKTKTKEIKNKID